MPAARTSRHVAFAADDAGGITPLILSLFIGLVLVTGAALDLLRHEAMRSDLQNALDRAVLAAVSPRQTKPADAVVRDYLGMRKYENGALALNVREERAPDGNARLAATARLEVETVFLAMVGVPVLEVSAKAAGPLPPERIEVSLVVDLSSSMRHGGRLAALKAGLTTFVREGLSGALRDRSRIALVPFAGRVNPGHWLFEAMGGNRQHDYSSCPDLQGRDFADTRIPRRRGIAQAPHEGAWPVAGPWMGRGWCPSDPAMGYVHVATGRVTTWAAAHRLGPVKQTIVNGTAITWPSNDADMLALRIDGMRLFHGSATHYGVKWGLAVLDPDNAGFIAGARRAERDGVLAPAEPPFADAVDGPASWDAPRVRKALVLVTDSAVSEVRRPDFSSGLRSGLLQHQRSAFDVLVGDGGRAHLRRLCALTAEHGVALFIVAIEPNRAAREDLRSCLEEISDTGATAHLAIAAASTLDAALFDVRRRIWGAALDD